MSTPVWFSPLLQKALLSCGILYALIIIGTDIAAGILTRGYHFYSQSANVLSGIGTTTRQFVLPLNIIAGVLLLAFSVGVWFSADGNWALRAMACLLAGNAIFTLIAVAFVPFYPSEPLDMPANVSNIILMATSVILFVLAIIFAVVGNRNWFRYFSVGIILVFILGAILSLLIHKFGGNAGPTVGVQERTMIYSEMIWIILQAIVLLRM